MLKRRHPDADSNPEEEGSSAKKAKTTIFSSIRDKFRSKKPEPPRSILSYRSENQGEQCFSPFSPNHSVNVSVTNTPTKKRVKFDELNLITSSITYQRHLNSSYQYTGIIPQKNENKSLLSRFLDFTASLF